ncbi:MAG: PAS domain-containing protein [Thiotrichaceae bacterium]|nr:PAS domain-containing protein [Thiotrichaceae bacterium]
MKNMTPDDIPGEYQEHMFNYHDGTQRKVLFTNIETQLPEGRLIVSRTDLNGLITDVNPSFIEMSAYHKDELIGQPHYILRHPEMPSAAFNDLWSTVKQRSKWHGYVKNLRKDGGFYWVYATVIANIRNGAITGFTSVRRRASRTKIDESETLYQTL